MELKGKKINFLGDSITEGRGASCYDNCYVEIFCKMTGAVCRNYGISGTRIAKQHKFYDARMDLDFCLRFDDMDDDADVVVIFGGTNDYGHGDAKIGSMQDRTSDTFYGGLHTLFCKAVTKYPTAKIVVMTPLHRANEDDLHFKGEDKQNGYTLKDHVEIIREVAEYYSLPVLDLFAKSGIQPNLKVLCDRYTSDGLHPNDNGHKRVAEMLKIFLEREF